MKKKKKQFKLPKLINQMYVNMSSNLTQMDCNLINTTLLFFLYRALPFIFVAYI